MSESNRRGALIGTGFFANNHLHAWAGLAGADIVAVCDLDENKAKAVANTFGIDHVYTDAATLLEEQDPDFVDVVTTVESHRPLVELACRADRLVICQKPFAETLEDAEAMVERAKQTSTHLLVHENFRWQQGFLHMKSLLDQGKIGAPQFARFSFRHGYDNYRNQPYLAEIERFAIMDVGLHLFDLARHFLGEVQALSCTTQRLNPRVKGEDAFTALLAHEQGATSIADVSFYSTFDPEPFPQALAVIEGHSGTLELTNDYRLIVHTVGHHEHIDVEPAIPSWGERPWHAVQDSVIRLQQHAIEIMHGKAQPQPSGEDNLRTLALALAAYESASTQQTVLIR